MKRKYYLIAIVAVIACISMFCADIQSALSLSNVDGVCLAAVGVPVFTPLKWEQGKNNMAGYVPRVLFIPEGAVASVPTVGFDDAKKAFVATGAFTFNSGENALTKPIYLYSSKGKVGYKAESQGEVDGISYKCTLDFFFPGNLPEMHLFNALVKNTPGYYIFEDVDRNQYVLGLDGFACDTTPSFDGGKAAADPRGSSYTVSADSNYTAVYMATPVDMQVIGGYKPEPTP